MFEFPLVAYRYAEIGVAANEIHQLLKENCTLFNMDSNLESKQWLDYVVYVDGIVAEALLKTIGCRWFT